MSEEELSEEFRRLLVLPDFAVFVMLRQAHKRNLPRQDDEPC